MDGTTHAYAKIDVATEHIQRANDNSGEHSKTDNHIIKKMARSSYKTVNSLFLFKDIQAPIPLYRTGGGGKSGESKKSSDPDKFQR